MDILAGRKDEEMIMSTSIQLNPTVLQVEAEKYGRVLFSSGLGRITITA